MKRTRIILITGAASLFAVAAFCSDPLPEESMNAVSTMLRFAQGNPRYVAGMNGCEFAREVLTDVKISYVDTADDYQGAG